MLRLNKTNILATVGVLAVFSFSAAQAQYKYITRVIEVGKLEVHGYADFAEDETPYGTLTVHQPYCPSCEPIMMSYDKTTKIKFNGESYSGKNAQTWSGREASVVYDPTGMHALRITVSENLMGDE